MIRCCVIFIICIFTIAAYETTYDLVRALAR